MRSRLLAFFGIVSLLVGCAGGNSAPPAPTAAEAAALLKDVDGRLLALGIDANQAGWVQQNFITVDTEAIKPCCPQ